MNIVILPLLVATQLNFNYHNDNDDNSKKEIAYNVIYNATTKSSYNSAKDNQLDTRPLISYNFETQLKCRLRAARILNCRLNKPMVFLSLYNSTSNDSVVADSDDGEKELAKFNFDIRFNRFGIKELVVPSTISPSILDMIRAIVNQLHTGIDFTNKTDGTYRSWENFTTGDCFTSYSVKLSNSISDFNNKTNGQYADFKKWQPQMTISINKTRNIEKCRCVAPYFFGSRESWQDHPKISIHLNASRSSIIANTTYFASSTETSLQLHKIAPRSSPNVILMLEKMSLVFHSISVTEQQIENIDDPASAGIVTGEWLHDDFSGENGHSSVE